MEKPHKFDIGEGYGIWEMDALCCAESTKAGRP